MKNIFENINNEIELKKLLNVMANFPNYSIKNQYLIYKQNPDAKFLRTENGYKEKNINLNKDVKGLNIFIPVKDENGNIINKEFEEIKVFDISETNGKLKTINSKYKNEIEDIVKNNINNIDDKSIEQFIKYAIYNKFNIDDNIKFDNLSILNNKDKLDNIMFKISKEINNLGNKINKEIKENLKINVNKTLENNIEKSNIKQNNINKNIAKKEINNEDYIKFTKIYLEKLILDDLKKSTQNENLTLDSEIINNFGEPINVGEQIQKYIEAIGNDSLKDFTKLENQIDNYLFDLKVNENYYKIDDEKSKNIQAELKKIKSELNQVEAKLVDKVGTSNLSQNDKNTFISKIKNIFDDFRNKINKFIDLFKINENNKTIDNTKNENNLTINNEMKVELLKINTLSSNILNKLSIDDDVSILRKIVNHPNTTAETLSYIANKSEDFKVIENLLNNHKTPNNVIDKLVFNQDRDIFLSALKHNNISENLLLKFSKTQDTEIINNILENNKCSEEVLQNIVAYNIKDEQILKTVINHKNCTENLNSFINEINNEPQKPSLKDKIKQKKEILNKTKQEKSTNKENKKEQNQNKSL